MAKKTLVLMLILSSLSMVGCVVINNGKDEEASAPETITKEVVVREESTTSTNNNSNRGGSSSSEYIFNDSDVNYLSSSDLSGLSKWELKVARNEIFARYGRLFNDDSLQKYFNSCSWYDGYISPSKFNENVLNKVEAYNVSLIQKYE